jgi:hypothetical protein
MNLDNTTGVFVGVFLMFLDSGTVVSLKENVLLKNCHQELLLRGVYDNPSYHRLMGEDEEIQYKYNKLNSIKLSVCRH